jgi:hypothetical protein
VAVDLLDNLGVGRTVGFLVIVLVVSIAAGSLLMTAACLLLLAVFAGLAHRARSIRRNLDQAGGQSSPE